MSDLISRSKVISILQQLNEHSLSGKMDISNAIYLLEIQQTAYDVDRVIEELEKATQYIKFNGTPTSVKAIHPTQAIEIVKHGGVSDDFCEWTQSGDMAISPHTFSKYKIKQCDGLYALSTCPYCGKKIKVVE